MTGPSAREPAGRRPSRNGRDSGGALERMAEALDCAVYELDCESGRIVWTTALTTGFGYPPDVIETGYDWWLERVHPDDRERAEREYRAALARGGERYAGEYRFQTSEGTFRDVLDRATIVRAPDGSPVRVVGAMVDLTETKRLEAELKDAESKYRDLVERIPLVTYIDEPNATASGIFVSPQVADLVGYTAEEWLADREFFPKILHADDRERVLPAVVRSYETGEPFSMDYRLIGRDGRVVWVHDESVIVRDDAGRPLCAQGFLLDITERTRMEEALRRSEAILQAVSIAAERFLRARSWHDVIGDVLARLGKAASASRVYIYENDEVADDLLVTSQKYEWVGEGIAPEIDNPALQRQSFPREWAAKLSQGLVVHGPAGDAPSEIRSLLVGQDVRSLAIVPVVEQEWWGLIGFDECREERAWSPAEIDALRAAAGTLGAAVQRERAEQGLQKANDDFQTVAAAIKCAIYEWDIAADEIRWTEGITAAFGYPLDGVGTFYDWWLGRVHPEDRERIDTLVRAAVAGGSDYVGEYRFRAKDGSYRHVWDSTTTVRDELGRPHRMLGGMLDVTELRRAEEAQRHLEEQLRQSQKMEAVGRLAGGIAHDFNNLLTVINGYGALAAEQLAGGGDARAELEEVQRAGQRVAELTRQLLAFSRQQVLQPVVLDLNAVVCEMERLLERVIGEDVELVTSLDPGLARVKADRGQIEQVIVNLAVNARDAMPEGGRLTIETANAELDESTLRRRSDVPAGRYVALTVTDTGVGMYPETRARAFDPFFTTKETGKGTGLGLATVHGIVEQSGGRVLVESEPGRGSSFRVFLPGTVEGVEHSVAREDGGGWLGGSETILLAEDEPAVRTLVREILERLGYRVIVAENGAKALEQAVTAGRIDLLVTDVVMPAVGGPELSERLLAERPGLSVLFMSGYAQQAVSDRAALPPGHGFLPKPFSPSDLEQRVRALLDASPGA